MEIRIEVVVVVVKRERELCGEVTQLGGGGDLF